MQHFHDISTMAKPKKTRKNKQHIPLPADRKAGSEALSKSTSSKSTARSQNIRETVESIVIAFVLAFLFRTFEAEAFVIPTGSMAPTLMGRHKDVDCTQCGQRFRINASDEASDNVLMKRAALRGNRVHPSNRSQVRREIDAIECVAGTCPVCRHTMPLRPNLPKVLADQALGKPVDKARSYNGDRIVVNKYIYSFTDPKRWDIVVFKYPGNAQMNYIKRLVGLPEETVRVYQGDLFTAKGENPADPAFHIACKPADKVLAMRQIVHDTHNDPAILHSAGWPLRWSESPANGNGNGGWQTEQKVVDEKVSQRFSVDDVSADSGSNRTWLRYQHLPAGSHVWEQIAKLPNREQQLPSATLQTAQPQLIADYVAYNSSLHFGDVNGASHLTPSRRALDYHWIGDLSLDIDINVKAAVGEVTFDLVEAGRHFSCRVDLATGKATLEAEGQDNFSPTAKTSLSKVGRHQVRFANVDDQLLFWVDGKLVAFDSDTQYDATMASSNRQDMVPRTSADDLGDLAPAGIGAQGAKLAITRLQVWRDNYYIASSHQYSGRLITDANELNPGNRDNYLTNPDAWDVFRQRRSVQFKLGPDQFFVMGDNSSASLDARLWTAGNGGLARPGGAYLERRLLIGKALCVYWPHSWNRVPGTPIPFPLFPNLSDMRLVR